MHHGTGLMCDIRTKINGAKGNRVEQIEIYNCINHKIRVNNDIFLIMISHTVQATNIQDRIILTLASAIEKLGEVN